MQRTLLMPILLAPALLHAQWCVPTSAIPYGPGMPGVTYFSCNTIDRTSADLENYPNNNYVNTGLSTELVRGSTYPVTINITLDAFICPHMNLRIWMDLNQDGQLDDPGETLLYADHVVGPSYTGTITLPTNAMLGSTRMRVTAKMCSHGGHLPPTPCDQPADPLGYHGELEDYTVVILDGVGLDESSFVTELSAWANDVGTFLTIGTREAAEATIDLLDGTGRVVAAEAGIRLVQGEQRVQLPALRAKGLYFARITTSGGQRTVRFVR